MKLDDDNTTYNSFYLFDLIFPSSLVQSRSIFIALVNFPCGSASIFIWKWQHKKNNQTSYQERSTDHGTIAVLKFLFLNMINYALKQNPSIRVLLMLKQLMKEFPTKFTFSFWYMYPCIHNYEYKTKWT